MKIDCGICCAIPPVTALSLRFVDRGAVAQDRGILGMECMAGVCHKMRLLDGGSTKVVEWEGVAMLWPEVDARIAAKIPKWPQS